MKTLLLFIINKTNIIKKNICQKRIFISTINWHILSEFCNASWIYSSSCLKLEYCLNMLLCIIMFHPFLVSKQWMVYVSGRSLTIKLQSSWNLYASARLFHMKSYFVWKSLAGGKLFAFWLVKTSVLNTLLANHT
jgi:hypothetical protein